MKEAARRKTTREIAEEIAHRLFENGFGQKAERLVMELPGKGNGGGWCEIAVVDQVYQVLHREEMKLT